MPTHSPLLRIHDMLESILGIEKAIKGKSYRDYQRSWVLRSAVERGIEVISEASRLGSRACDGGSRTFNNSEFSCGCFSRAVCPIRGRAEPFRNACHCAIMDSAPGRSLPPVVAKPLRRCLVHRSRHVMSGSRGG
jgi:hypothetical protein